MKIACESCGARYSIAEEKVRGKAFRIRCKRCGEAMIVRGAEATADPAPPGGASEVGPVWHLVLDGEPRGPFRTDTVTQMLAGGSIDEDTYVWRSGREAWSRLGEVEALAGPTGAGVASVVSSAPSVVAELGADTGMTGARHESSVLFSLGTLQSLAMRGQASPRAPRASAAPGVGSGLLDLRALTAGAPSTSAAADARGIEELLSIGVPGVFPSPLGAPVLLPAPARSTRLLHALVAVAALLLLGIVGLLALALGQGRPPPVPAIAPVVGAAPIAAPLATPPAQPIAIPNAGAPTPSEPPARDPSAERPAVPRDVIPRHRPEGPRVSPRDVPPPREESGHDAHVVAKSAGRESIEELVRRAVEPEDGAAPPPPRDPEPRPVAPAQPARADVHAALRAVQGAVRACAEGRAGTATIRFVFATTGLVTTTSVVSPPFAGTPAGSCMARAARSARVPPFSGQSLVVTYPFVVR